MLKEGQDYRLVEVKKANELKQWGGGNVVVLTIGAERFQAEVVRKGRGWDIDFAVVEDGKRTDRIIGVRFPPGSDQFDSDDQWVDKIEKVEFIVRAEELKF